MSSLTAGILSLELMNFNQKLEEGKVNLHMQTGKNSMKIFMSRENSQIYIYIFIYINYIYWKEH